MSQYRPLRFLLAVGFALVVAGCGNPEPISPGRYLETDQLVSRIDENLAASATLSKIVDIDHSRLAQEAGSFMPPARVLIFSDAQLEADLIQQNPLVALDLPLRVLAFEAVSDGASKIIYNSFDYLLSRYHLDPGSSRALKARYIENVDAAINGIEPEAIAAFSNDAMDPDGIITITSPYGYEETIERVTAAINAQSDTVHFGTVDFRANARELGIDIAPAYMILFGAPGPGGKAMAEAPTLGLDGFCQKFLIWEGASGQIKLSFNDLLALADRQGTKKALALRVINYRLTKTFSDALAIE
ncbi:DUF302 domain-containing protein [Pseudohalioglobus sediminis]|nr:DUF302 domain-containing protein [Pseudohalioglobus sediminis]